MQVYRNYLNVAVNNSLVHYVKSHLEENAHISQIPRVYWHALIKKIINSF